MKASDYSNLAFSGIYLFRNTLNGRVYVGQAGNIYHRIYDHLKQSRLRRKAPLYRAAKKYGWDSFSVEVLERVDDPSLLNERETYWIKHYNSCENGYNVLENGDTSRGYNHTEEAKRKMSEAASKRTGSKNHFYGKTHSLESRRKISIANKGRVRPQHIIEQGAMKCRLSNKTRRPVNQIDPESNQVIQTFPSISAAARFIDVASATLMPYLQKKPGRKTCKGYKWEYVDD
jgi:group I intron endonuclease